MKKGKGNEYLFVKLGSFSSLICALCFVIYTISFLMILIINPLYTWENLSHFIEYCNEYNQVFMYTAMLTMLLFALSYVVLLNTLREFADPKKRILASISLHFGLLFAVLIGINYFLQVTTVRLYIFEGQSTGLEQLVQSNPISASAAINMLGWTIFLGLSSLFMAFVFNGSSLERFIRYSFLANGINSLLAFIGFFFQHFLLTSLTMFLGLGVTIFCISISLWILFRQLEKDRCQRI